MSQKSVIVDYRERGLLDRLRALHLPLAVENLPVGDVHIRDEATQEPVLIVERKTLTDLKASILDGRLPEQRLRLQNSGVRSIYVVEGVLEPTQRRPKFAQVPTPANGDLLAEVQRFPADRLVGACINLLLRDNLSVIRTSCVEETAVVLYKWWRWLGKEDELARNEAGAPSEVEQRAKAALVPRSHNFTPDVWYCTLLASVPRMSTARAEAVRTAGPYPTLLALCTAIQQDRTKTLEDLANVMCGTRRLGPEAAKRVVAFVEGSDGPSSTAARRGTKRTRSPSPSGK